MSRQEVYQLEAEIKQWMPSLKKWQRRGLAMFSMGMVLSERCTLSKVSETLVFMGKADSVERRLQRWLSNERVVLKVLWLSWIRWIMRLIGGEEVVVLIDETKLGKHLGVMMVGLAYRRCCIPLVWRVYDPKAYPAEGQVGIIKQLLLVLREALETDTQVIIQADRGIGTSPKLVEVIQSLGFNYLMRVQGQTRFRHRNGKEYPLKHLVKMGESWAGHGSVFKKHGWLSLHVYVYWELGYDDLWCLVSNLSHLCAKDYACRYWQEASFRDLKSDGWQWQRSQVWLPQHADRLILAMALAYVWILSHGTHIALADDHERRKITRRKHAPYSIFREGLRYFIHLRYHAQLYFSMFLVPQPILAHQKSVVP